jgi:GAF domain-containing protein
MIEPATPGDDRHRVEALRALGLLDTKPERAFDDIVALARKLLNVPMALVTLIDADRQWFKAADGIAMGETSRSASFCGHAILQSDVFVVPDATEDPRFHDNPFVVGAPHVRFYAGMPLRLPNGYRIGTVCALSDAPREDFADADMEIMRALGRLALDAIASRTARATLARARETLDRYEALWETLETPLAFADEEGRIQRANAAFALLCGGPKPDGRPAGEALGLAADAWSASAMEEGELWAQRVRGAAGTEVTIYRGLDGFALVGDPIPK